MKDFISDDWTLNSWMFSEFLTIFANPKKEFREEKRIKINKKGKTITKKVLKKFHIK